MMRILSRHLLILLSCLQLYSCTYLQPTPVSLNKNLDHWLTENKYEKIENALKKINKNDPEFKNIIKQIPTIQSRKDGYIDNVSITAKKLKNENKWQEAIETYASALNNINKDPRLLKEHKALIEDRDNQVNELRKKLLIENASALISYKKIYAELHQLIPEDYNAQFDINRFENDRRDVARHLDKCGEQARKNNQFILARDCYSLSNQLEPADDKQAWVTKIDNQLKSQSDQQRHSELLTAYKLAYGKNEYNKARMHLTTLLAISPNHTQANNYLKALNAELGEQISSKISLGKDLYSQKKINEALKVWKQAQRLDQENDELIQLISRAEKVSKKIESLENKQ